MTKQEKQLFLNNRSIGYISACDGLEIKTIDIDNNFIVFVCNAWYGKKNIHKKILHSDKNNQLYFLADNTRFYINDIIAMW